MSLLMNAPHKLTNLLNIILLTETQEQGINSHVIHTEETGGHNVSTDGNQLKISVHICSLTTKTTMNTKVTNLRRGCKQKLINILAF